MRARPSPTLHRRRYGNGLELAVGIFLIVASITALAVVMTMAVHYDCYINPPRVQTLVHALACPQQEARP